jgi:hypothetical protein
MLQGFQAKLNIGYVRFVDSFIIALRVLREHYVTFEGSLNYINLIKGYH